MWRKIIKSLFELIVGIAFLLLFSFCMWLGSTKLGKQEVDTLGKINDTIVFDTLNPEVEDSVQINDTLSYEKEIKPLEE